MSFSELMQHAKDIQEKAITAAMKQFTEQTAAGKKGPWMGSTPGEADMLRDIEKSFDDIPALFQPFAEMPDPASFDWMIEDMTKALKTLAHGQTPKDPINDTVLGSNTELDKLSDSFIEDWTGRAAMEFKENFIDPFPSIVSNQFIIAAVLKGALAAQQEVWARARIDIDKIAHDALEALDRMEDCGKNEWTMTFTVAASVAAIGAVPLTGGAAFTVTAVGAAAQVAAAAAPEEPSIRFSGESAKAVVNQVRQAAEKLVEYIQNQEAKIAGALRNTHNLVTSDRKSFVANRPELAGATANNVTGPLYMGYSR